MTIRMLEGGFKPYTKPKNGNGKNGVKNSKKEEAVKKYTPLKKGKK